MMRDKVVPFIALTLLIEYDLARNGDFRKRIKQLTQMSLPVPTGLNTWLGETSKKVIFHRIADEAEEAELLINFMGLE